MKAVSLRNRLSEGLDIPAEALGAPLVSITGRNTLRVENHSGITDYSRENISILTPDGQIRVSGTEIEIKAMDREALIIRGRIDSVEWI